MNTQINIHAVTSIVVEQRILAEPGHETHPEGLICTQVMFESDDGPIKVVCFGVDNTKAILVTTLKGPG